MELTQLDALLTILRKHDVTTYKDGVYLIQLAPKLPDFDKPDVSPEALTGGWKRHADLTE